MLINDINIIIGINIRTYEWQSVACREETESEQPGHPNKKWTSNKTISVER